MKQRKIPLRTCVITKESLPKSELLRVVRTPEGDVQVDETGKLNGRGAYIKKDINVLQTAKEKKMLERALECQISDKVYSEIEKVISNI